MLKRSLACAAAGMALAAGGCGSSGASSTHSRAAFKSGFAASQTAFRALGTDIARDITGAGSRTDAQLSGEFRALAQRAAEQATQLAALHPPAAYRRRVGTLVRGFHAVRADLSEIATAATRHSSAGAEGATRALLRDAARIKAADVSLSRTLGLPAPGAATSTTSQSSSASSSG